MADEASKADAAGILVEIAGPGGLSAASTPRGRGPREAIERLSAEQVARALGLVKTLADQARAMVADLQAQPRHDDLASMEMAFGLSFNGELQAYVAKTSSEASLTIRLTWEGKGKG